MEISNAIVIRWSISVRTYIYSDSSLDSDIDEYGFKRDENFDYKGYETFMKSYLTVLTNRGIKWDKYMKKKPNLFRNNSNQLKRYVRKGIPGKCKKISNFSNSFFHVVIRIQYTPMRYTMNPFFTFYQLIAYMIDCLLGRSFI